MTSWLLVEAYRIEQAWREQIMLQLRARELKLRWLARP